MLEGKESLQKLDVHWNDHGVTHLKWSPRKAPPTQHLVVSTVVWHSPKSAGSWVVSVGALNLKTSPKAREKLGVDMWGSVPYMCYASVPMTLQGMTWMWWLQMLPSSIRRIGLCPSCWQMLSLKMAGSYSGISAKFLIHNYDSWGWSTAIHFSALGEGRWGYSCFSLPCFCPKGYTISTILGAFRKTCNLHAMILGSNFPVSLK